MSKHSKGPWHKGDGNGAGSIFSKSGRMRMGAGGTTLYPIAEVNTGWNTEEDEANANLIVKAPDLYDLAEMVAAGFSEIEQLEEIAAGILADLQPRAVPSR